MSFRYSFKKSCALLAVAAPLSLVSLGLVTGCGITPGGSAGTPLAALGGAVHGGQSPIQGATVVLYVTSATATGYGQPSTVIGSATTDVNGNFAIAPSATTSNCPAGQQAYITAAGGYPSGAPAQANTSTLMMAALGNCSTVNSATRVILNEVTTVAAAYALSGFMTTSTTSAVPSIASANGATPLVAPANLYQANISAPTVATAATGTTAVTAGLPHAFANAQNLAVYSTGQAQSQTAPLSVAGTTVNGSVPAAEINTLADILQSCINGATGNTPCTSLFSFTPSISGVTPSNTLQAMINLARNPYPSAAAMTAATGLFSLVSSSPAFLPNLSAQPPDWSMAVVYKGTALVAPYYLTLDANDSLFYSASGSVNVVGLSPYGTSLPTFTGTTGASRGIAADALGNVWVANSSTSVFGYSTSAGGAAATTLAVTGPSYGVAVDKANNVWAGSSAAVANNIQEFMYNASAAYTNPFNATTPGSYQTYGLTFDQNQNLWVAPYLTAGSTLAVAFPNSNAASTTTTPAYSTTPLTATFTGSATKPIGVVIDATGNAWYGITGSNTTATTGLEEVIPSVTSSVITALNPQTLITGTTLGAKASQMPGIDGAGTIYLPDNQGTGALGIHAYSTASVTSSGTGSQVLSPPAGYLGCLPTANPTTGAITCGAGTTTSNYGVYNPRQIAIDSTGSVWAGITSGGVTQIIGLGAPSWPLLSIGKPGIAPGFTAALPLP